MKRSIVVVMGMLLLWGWSASASFFVERMYCVIQTDAIQISLQKNDNFLCQSYLQAIQKSMRKTAEDMLLVQWYIQDRQDLWYRLKVRDILRERFIKTDTMKKSIEYSINIFEHNIFTKLKDYLATWLEGYYYQLLSIRDGWDEEELPIYHTQVTEQLDLIDGIRSSTWFDDMMPLATRYLYLKKDLVWKLGL